jgi:hypothetical protein
MRCTLSITPVDYTFVTVALLLTPCQSSCCHGSMGLEFMQLNMNLLNPQRLSSYVSKKQTEN